MSQDTASPAASRRGYQCQDCSYCSSKGFPGGRCPGCGSFNVRRLDQAETPLPTPMARKNFRLALLVTLWFYLAFLLWERIQQL